MNVSLNVLKVVIVRNLRCPKKKQMIPRLPTHTSSGVCVQSCLTLKLTKITINSFTKGLQGPTPLNGLIREKVQSSLFLGPAPFTA